MKSYKDLSKLTSLLSDREFQSYVSAYRESRNRNAQEWAEKIIGAFVLRSWLLPVVEAYLITGTVNESYIDDPVKVEPGDVDGSPKLVLAHDITQPILKEWIVINWSQKIKPQLETLPEKRNLVPNTTRDESIYQDYINRKKLSLNVVGVAFKNEVHPSTVYRIISRKKKDLN